MLIACNDRQIIFVVPGTNWKLSRLPTPGGIVTASSGAINVSVALSDDAETAYGVREYLTAIYRGARGALERQGHEVSWAAPPDDPAWQDTQSSAGLVRRTMNLADAFFVTDGSGNLPPQ